MTRNYLKKLREDHGFSQFQMAEKLEITQQYYSLIENGDRQQKMNVDFLVKLADIFKVSLSDLIEMERSEAENDPCRDGESVPGNVSEVRRPAV